MKNEKTTRHEIHDATEEQNERLHLDGNSYDGHINMGHIPPVMTDIPSPGVTREDNNDQQLQNNSDDKDPNEDSDKMKGQTEQQM